MADVSQETLLGYLLDALEDDERDALAARLSEDASLRRQLDQARSQLAVLRNDRLDDEPPPGLAEATCRYVAGVAERRPRASAGTGDLRPLARRPMFGDARPAGGDTRWRWPDVLVSGCVVLVAMVLVIPAIEQSRNQARINTCQNNLREIGGGLDRYSENHDGFFPVVPQEGRLATAAYYAPALRSERLLPDNARIICPDSPLADNRPTSFPTLPQLASMSDDRFKQVRGTLGGSYGYTLGHTERGHYQGTRNLGRSNFAIMSDTPGRNGMQTGNHGGRGQNVLMEDGSVRFIARPDARGYADNFFLNESGVVAAGNHRDDAVIGAPYAAPRRLQRDR